MKAIAVITARGGSKRIPRKNIKDFCGKPIIAYSIRAALDSGVFEKVMVSTEDEEIAQIAREWGAEVPFLRSQDTAGDFATTTDVMLEVLQELESRGETYETICCIYPTAPLLSAETLKHSVELLEEHGADSVIPVVRYGFPPQRCVVMDGEFLAFKWPEYMFARSQDLEPFYHDAGQFYCTRTESLREQKKMFMERTVPMELSELEVQDIDNESDWKIAELKYQMLKGNS